METGESLTRRFGNPQNDSGSLQNALALWFGLHVIFGEITRIDNGLLSMTWPVWSTINLAAVALFALSAIMLLKFHAGLARTLGACALIGLVLGAMRIA